MLMQYATLEDTVYFWFGANDTAGSGADGASPVYDVRLAGAASDAAPVLSGNATLLSHANYPAGAHEVAIAATAGNGFAANSTYSVFCTLAVDGQNPTGFVGAFNLKGIKTEIGTGTGLSAIPWNASWDAEVQSECADALTAYDPPTHAEVTAAFTEIKGATWAATDTLEAIRDRGDAAWVTATGFSTHSAADVKTAIEAGGSSIASILADTGEMQTDLHDGGRLDLILDAIAGDVVNLDGAAMRGTDSAALASVCSEARLSELDAGTAGKMANQVDVIETDTTALDGRLTSARAGYLDKLNITGTLLHSAFLISDAESLTAGSIPEALRKMKWFQLGDFEIDEVTGDFIFYKDDGTTPGITGNIASDSGTTMRDYT